ncbi:MAG: hypothetical protein KKA07_06910, partial [Bacteroidetes bacterium]|nr:hypothetical protein [Bacteroidota bacterium]MBU1718788.1 hypothetical protein [Bacteroidota bacterium]
MRSNKLYHVADAITSTYDTDIDDQETEWDPEPSTINSVNNYSYDKIGNLIKDISEGIENIEWTVSGKVRKIKRYSSSNLPELEFLYDPMGNR